MEWFSFSHPKIWDFSERPIYQIVVSACFSSCIESSLVLGMWKASASSLSLSLDKPNLTELVELFSVLRNVPKVSKDFQRSHITSLT